MRHLFLSFICLFTLLSLVLCGCKSSTSPQKGSIVGTVSLSGQTDNSGVSVLLYRAGYVPSELSELNQSSPQVAFTLSDPHFFDHRELTPLYSTVSSSNGEFSFSDLMYGNYVIVYFKTGWGYNYLFDIELATSTLDIDLTHELVLNPIVTLDPFIDNSYLFENNRCYVADHDVTFLPDCQVTFMGGSKILVAPGSSITIHGLATFLGDDSNATIVTSHDKIYTAASQPQPFTKMQLSEDSNSALIKGIVLSESSEGLVVMRNYVTIQNSIFQFNDYSIQTNNLNGIVISDNVFITARGSNSNAVYFSMCTAPIVQNCIFWDNQNALFIQGTVNTLVTNNYFSGGTKQVFSIYESGSVLSHNTFRNTQYAVTNTAQSNMELNYNDIQAQVCVYTYHTLGMGNLPSHGWTKAANNNFIGSQYTVRAEAFFYYYQSDPYFSLDFKNNFWNSTSASTIDASIIDYNDLQESPEYALTMIDYRPYRTSKVSTAGVQ